MGFRVLGPVEVWAGARRLEIGPPRQRTVLAVLVASRDEVPVEALIERVWGDAAPGAARRGLHSYVTRVRRVVEQVESAAAPVRVVRGAGGYRLVVPDRLVDLRRFEALAERVSGTPPGARGVVLDEALGLWRGEPLGGIPGEWAARTRRAWWRRYFAVLAGWAQVALARGDADEVVARLGPVAAEHPLAEPVVEWLMRAQAAAGHTAEALDQYVRTARLVPGGEPGVALRRAHEEILTRTRPARGGRPAMLPADVAGFAGRVPELARLDQLVAGEHRIAVVSGTAGVGKTALAVHWAHRLADRFPDGQLYVDLRGFHGSGQATEPAAVLRGFLAALGVPALQVPAEPAEQAARYGELLAGRRVLVVLDNALDADHIGPLLAVGPDCRVLITSRNRLAVEGADPIRLDPLSAAEAAEFLAHRLGPALDPEADGEAVAGVAAACAGLPLALAVAAGRAVATGLPLSEIARELAHPAEQTRLLDGADAATRVRSVLSWSYAALRPEAARAFRLLGLHPGPTVTVAAAASLTALPAGQAQPLLAELATASMLTESAPGRYALHDLLAAYAAELAADALPPEESRAATDRLLDHYLHSAYAADRQLAERPPSPLPPTPPAGGAVPLEFADHREALDWLVAEHRPLLAALRVARAAGADGYVGQLAWALAMYLWTNAHWTDMLEALAAAAGAADRLARPALVGWAQRERAAVLTRLGEYEQARGGLEAALAGYDRAGDQAGRAHTHLAFALLYGRQQRYADAVRHAEQALELYRGTGAEGRQAMTLSNLGWYHAQLGNDEAALLLSRQAIGLHERSGYRFGQAAGWDGVGFIHHRRGEYARAEECFRRSIEFYREVGGRYNEATVRIHLADTLAAAGNPAAARTEYLRAHAALTELAHADAAAVRAKLEAL